MLIGDCRECYSRPGGSEGTVFCERCLRLHRDEAERRKIERAERTMFARIADLIEPRYAPQTSQ